MAATTTIKVDPEVRDRLNTTAAARGVTPGRLVDELLTSYERAQWFADIRAAYDRLPAEDDYVAETIAWNETNGDGLAAD